MSTRRASPLLASLALAVTLLGAIAAPAAETPSGVREDAAAFAPIELEGIALHARVGEQNTPRPVLIPGVYWAPLAAPVLRLVPRAPVRSVARLERTVEGWVLAHSTATSLP